MHRRDHSADAGHYYACEKYTLALQEPGGQRIIVPAAAHFVDVHLGRSTATYSVSGIASVPDQSPPTTFVYLPSGTEREISATRSGWSIQLTFGSNELDNEIRALNQHSAGAFERLRKQPICHQEDVALLGVAQTLYDVWTTKANGPSASQFNAAAHLIVSRIASYLAGPVERNITQDTLIEPRLQLVLDHIQENLSLPLPLEELASLANLSMYHFARVFRTSMGKSPHQYIVERRVAAAKKQLDQTDAPIAQIAYDCGFSSQSHLTVTFRRVYGTTPGMQRRKRAIKMPFHPASVGVPKN